MQEAFVAVMVAWAAFAVAARYAPRALRQRARSTLVRILGRLGCDISRFASDARRSSGSCGGCSGCDGKAHGGSAGTRNVSVDALRRTARRQAR